jgi:site-specific DNA-adenine methylase
MEELTKLISALANALGPAEAEAGMLNLLGTKGVTVARDLAQRAPKADILAEPFVGAGSFFTEFLKQGKAKKALINDLSPVLYKMYKDLQQAPIEVMASFRKLIEPIASRDLDKQQQVILKDIFNTLRAGGYSGIDETAARLVIGNKNMRWDLNRTPQPQPSGTRLVRALENNISDVARALQKSELTNLPAEEFIRLIPEEALVLADPPYYKTAKYHVGEQLDESQKLWSRLLEELSPRTQGVVYNSAQGGKFYPWLDMQPTGSRVPNEVSGFWGDWK